MDLVRVKVLQLNPGTGSHLWGKVRMVSSVGFIEAEDDVVLLVNGVVDVVHPGLVVLNVPGDHGHEGLA